MPIDLFITTVFPLFISFGLGVFVGWRLNDL